MMKLFARLAALAVGLTAAEATAQQCRVFEPGTERAAIDDAQLDEVSGLAAGWANPEVFWAHNDSGDSARIFAIDRTGKTVTVLALPDVEARDWEDIAVGPCASGSATPCIYVGDIGDNNKVRDDIRIHRFEEPTLGDAPPASLEVTAFDTFEVAYEGGPLNAETLLVHPTTAEMFIVDKTFGDPSNLWKVPTDAASVTAIKVVSFDLGEPLLGGGLVTGGDFAPDGNEISIRTYTSIYTFCGPDPVAAFSAEPTRVVGFDFFQSEALTYSRDGESIWSTSEIRGSEKPPLVEMPVVPPAMEPPPDDAGEPGPDAASAPRDDGGTHAAPMDRPPASSGCNCSQVKAETPLGGLGLVLLLLGLFRLRTATAPTESGRRADA